MQSITGFAEIHTDLAQSATPSQQHPSSAETKTGFLEVSLDDGIALKQKASSQPASYTVEASLPACRMCLEDASGEALVAPCSCSGSLQWAHSACVQTWINNKGDKLCEICRQPYKGPYRDPPSKPAPVQAGPAAAALRGATLMPQSLVQMAMSHRSEDGDEHTERDGAQSSAAWCLSAVLLFMSLLLLRQAFEPLSRPSEAPRTAVNAGGQNRHMATVPGAPASPLHLNNMTTTVLLLPLGSAAGPGLTDEQVESSGSLLWVAAKVLMFLVPFLLLLRVVTAMREIRLSRRSSGHTADHSFAAILLNMEAGMRDDQFARTPIQLHPAVAHISTPLLPF
ncbi:hypothetical protein CVIRNUC_010681 [Coccomyxa viridis]|uniref:RING-CH-type domain-containing protein n=1 Tax=Coccomyxa viridis TaxID=1274662 RepID=A0AAV1ILF5_9CHLO|nr:hypothetical protein CVIRNUC_010681 [Coccomyxa viridis]